MADSSGDDKPTCIGKTTHGTKIFLKTNQDGKPTVYEEEQGQAGGTRDADADVTFSLDNSDKVNIHVIVNPKAGSHQAPSFAKNVLIPFLDILQIPSSHIHYHTTRKDTNEEIANTIRNSIHPKLRLIVFCLGGDGTTYDFLNDLKLTPNPSTSSSAIHKHIHPSTLVDLSILPLGTANAFFYSLFPPASKDPFNLPETFTPLRSVLPLFVPNTKPKPISLAKVTIGEDYNHAYVAHVVVSAALHASILYDAQVEIGDPNYDPGDIDIFKRAALKNLGRSYPGRLVLHGPILQKYDPSTKSFKAIVNSNNEDTSLSIEGPFGYLNSCLVERFEPNFVVAPLRNNVSSPEGLEQKLDETIDIVTCRPYLYFNNAKNNPDGLSLEDWQKQLIWKLSGGMYDGGKHVDMLDTENKPLLEYWRCSSYTWVPDQSQDEVRHRIVCIDGDTVDIKGSANVHVAAFSTASSSCPFNVQTWA